MNRLLLVGAGLVVTAALGVAQPPAAAGRERTHIQQELYLPDPPTSRTLGTSTPGRGATPEPSGWTVGDLRGWLVRTTVGSLGGTPLVHPELW